MGETFSCRGPNNRLILVRTSTVAAVGKGPINKARTQIQVRVSSDFLWLLAWGASPLQFEEFGLTRFRASGF